VIEEIELAEIKTKALAGLIARMGFSDEKVLILTGELDDKLALSSRNIPNVLAMPAREANAYTVVASDWVLFTRKGLTALEEVLA
jgi:large subunit ribosomal protein L4